MSIPDLMQFSFLVIVLLAGISVLLLRRNAKGSKSFYKLVLVLLGVVIAGYFFKFNDTFINYTSVCLLVILSFELSSRLNPENISLSKKSLYLFFGLLFANAILLGLAATFLLKLNPLIATAFAILMCSIEYFMVDELKEEGDLANPFLILFTFSILTFYEFSELNLFNVVYILQNLLIGLGMGIATGIIVFKMMKNHKVTWFHEIALLAAALIVYIFTQNLGGSGIFAVMILGLFFGNSYVREKVELKNLSPFIFKPLEVLIFILIGFVINFRFDLSVLWKAAALFLIYLIIRFVIILILFKRHSFHNKMLLTFAPKGMVFAVMLLVLGSYKTIAGDFSMMMMWILCFSLFLSSLFEYFENKKIEHFEKVFYVLRHLRFGRKKDLKK